MTMKEVKFTLTEWKKHLGDISFEKAALRGLKSGAMAALPVLHQATAVAPPASPNGTKGAFNTGRYRQSWKSTMIDRGVSVFNSAPYAPIVEEGRRKGAKQPPTKPIAKWVQRKLGVTQQEAENAAFVIARAIKKRGLKPRGVLKSALPDIRKVMIREVTAELKKELAAKK